MLQNPCKTLGFKKIMVYKIPGGGGGVNHIQPVSYLGSSLIFTSTEPVLLFFFLFLFCFVLSGNRKQETGKASRNRKSCLGPVFLTIYDFR